MKPLNFWQMKTGLICFFFLATIFSCITKSRYQKAADEIAEKMPPSHNMNVGKEKYDLYVPPGWSTKHQTAYDMDFYYLLAPKTLDNPNTNINVLTEYMQNLNLEDFLQKTIESVLQAIPSARFLGKGTISANGLNGAWYSYSMQPEEIPSTLVSYIFPKDGVAYVITAGIQTKDFGHYRSLFDSVARSLRFDNRAD
jgi:hypothetical protein